MKTTGHETNFLFTRRTFSLSTAVIMLILTTSYGWCDGLKVTNLRCEFQSNPVGIDSSAPRLNWQVASSEHDQEQSAYQVLVASKTDLLKPGQADLWDSGKRESTSTLQIPYKGKPLQSNQKVYWTVRSWDKNGNPSPWSDSASWTTSLMSPSDWQAQWIGTEKDAASEVSVIENAKWIWATPEQDAKDPGATDEKPAAKAVRYFRTQFNLPADATLPDARLYISADNEADIYINGTLLGSHDKWEILKTLNPGSLLKPGNDNIIAVKVTNTGSTANSAGLAMAFSVPRQSAPDVVIATDDSWEVSRAPDKTGWPADLTSTTSETATWKNARVLGKWGTSPWHKISRGQHPVIPIFRKDFQLTKPVRQALVHVSGLGHYVLSINGEKIGDHYLDPAWSKYEKTVFYNTFDITANLKQQANAIGVMIGKGFYTTAGDRRIHGSYADRALALILQAEITFEDGSTTTIITDTSWKWKPGPLTHNSILGGTDYDARLLPENWDTAAFDDSDWKTAVQTTEPGGTLKSAYAPPMRQLQQFKPVSIEEPEPGHFVYDFGQNASAAPRLTVSGQPGQTIKLTWAEQRKGQDPYTNNGKGVVDQSGIGHGFFTYTLRGDGQDETWFSELCYTGYQYLELTGGVPEGKPNPEGKPVVKELTSVHVQSDQPEAGTFATSNEMYNRIDTMIDWAVRSNLAHVFTDCPTREKLGWLEVPWLMWASVASRYDIAAFGEKISGDIRDSQLPDGQILTVAPSYPEFGGGFHYTPEWGAAGVFVPWYLYQWYADTHALETNYEMMSGFVDYMTSTSDNLIAAPGLGDWYDYLPGEKLGASRFTPPDLTATAVFAGCADILSSSAAVLGKPDDVAKYAGLAADIRVAFNKRFRTAPGRYEHTSSPQTAHAMALVFDMVPHQERAAAAQAIVDDLKKRDWQQTSGDVGYRFLINALSQTGHSDAIFKILNRDEIGSYAYLVNSGWTSLPEAWNANPTSSMNHCMLGHIQEWFTQHLLGIAPAQGSIGFDTIAIQPTPGDGVTSASGTYLSPRGPVSLAWQLDDKTLTCEFTVPANSSALVRLPVSPRAEITSNGEPVSADQRMPRDGDREVIRVPSGHYIFVAEQ